MSSSYPLNILNTFIKSPLSLFVSSVVNYKFFNLVSYFNSERLFFILVAFFELFLKWLMLFTLM